MEWPTGYSLLIQGQNKSILTRQSFEKRCDYKCFDEAKSLFKPFQFLERYVRNFERVKIKQLIDLSHFVERNVRMFD